MNNRVAKHRSSQSLNDKSEQGIVIVEAAIILFLIVVLIFQFVSLVFLLKEHAAMVEAVGQGVRSAVSLRNTPRWSVYEASLQNRVKEVMENSLSDHGYDPAAFDSSVTRTAIQGVTWGSRTGALDLKITSKGLMRLSLGYFLFDNEVSSTIALDYGPR